MLSDFLRDPFWIEIENWPLSWEIGGTWLFPFIESIHVVTIAMVVGSILFVDLRLLGLTAMRYSIRNLSRELIPWTWGAFAIATVTGLGMFITRAASHVLNPAFQWKMILVEDDPARPRRRQHGLVPFPHLPPPRRHGTHDRDLTPTENHRQPLPLPLGRRSPSWPLGRAYRLSRNS